MVQELGQKPSESRGRGYTVLREEASLDWKHDNEFGRLVFERMHRNVLETAARIVLFDFERRRLVNSLLELLDSDNKLLTQLVSHKRIHSHLVKTFKDKANNGSNVRYYYALSACRQVRKALDDKQRSVPTQTPSDPVTTNQASKRNTPVGNPLKANYTESTIVLQVLHAQISEWRANGFPFAVPQFGKHTMDFAASTENATG
jgi:hypothetical protein